MVERGAPLLAKVPRNLVDSRSSLSDPALPGHLSLRERRVLASPP